MLCDSARYFFYKATFRVKEPTLFIDAVGVAGLYLFPGWMWSLDCTVSVLLISGLGENCSLIMSNRSELPCAHMLVFTTTADTTPGLPALPRSSMIANCLLSSSFPMGNLTVTRSTKYGTNLASAAVIWSCPMSVANLSRLNTTLLALLAPALLSSYTH